MAGRRKTSPAAIETDERQTAALNLRKAGVTFEEIARQLGFASASGAYEAVKSALAKARQEPANELREIMAARLDEMLVVAYENALQGDVDSMMAVLRIEERRAKLFGIDRRDAPVMVKLPKLERAQDAVVIVGSLIGKVAAGEISPDDANRIAGLLGVFAKTTETAQLAEKLAQFEELARESAERGKGNERN